MSNDLNLTSTLKLVPNKQVHITPDNDNLITHYGVVVVIDVVDYKQLNTLDSQIEKVLAVRPRAVHERWVRFAYESSPTMDKEDMEEWVVLPMTYFLRRTSLLGNEAGTKL